jgi:hypothetical protein
VVSFREMLVWPIRIQNDAPNVLNRNLIEMDVVDKMTIANAGCVPELLNVLFVVRLYNEQ